jgi:hypothetical protein
MLELASDYGLLSKPPHEKLIVQYLRSDHFEGAQFVECQVHGLINRSHSSLAHFAQNAILPADYAPFGPDTNIFKRRAILWAHCVVIGVASLACGAGFHVAPFNCGSLEYITATPEIDGLKSGHDKLMTANWPLRSSLRTPEHPAMGRGKALPMV